ncbi:hypothetical protein DFH08DRAFT_950941 [Mycena albidolilacea]|uniref:Uncharacterized protein n=1 Tax=Mycena albidolilacea TaxID=1033008 RepID=A0AAD7AMD5_9AGAR|nr:hypothetical protein DFH08DRAFT_950941 [Mycena albidolilacea]
MHGVGTIPTPVQQHQPINPEYPIFEILADEFRAGWLSPEVAHYFFNSTRSLIAHLPSEVRNPAWSHGIIPEDPKHSGRFFACTFVIPRGPHKDLSLEPYPVMDMAAPDPMWNWWRRLQEYPRPVEADPSLPFYLEFVCGDLFPTLRAYDTPFAVARTRSSDTSSADWTFRDCLIELRHLPVARQRWEWTFRGPRDIHGCSAASRYQHVRKLLILPYLVGALIELPLEARKPPAEVRNPRILLLYSFDSKGRPLIKLKSSRKSSTPPASEAFNKEGEEEKEEEEEEEEEPARPAKHQRTSSSAPKRKGKAKAKADTPTPSSSSSNFPPTVYKTQGKSKKAELLAYIPP